MVTDKETPKTKSAADKTSENTIIIK